MIWYTSWIHSRLDHTNWLARVCRSTIGKEMTRLRPQTHRKRKVPSTTNKCCLQDRGRKTVGLRTHQLYNSPTERKYTIEFYCAKGIQVDLACSFTPEYYVFCVFPKIFSGVLAVISLEGKPVNIQTNTSIFIPGDDMFRDNNFVCF